MKKPYLFLNFTLFLTSHLALAGNGPSLPISIPAIPFIPVPIIPIIIASPASTVPAIIAAPVIASKAPEMPEIPEEDEVAVPVVPPKPAISPTESARINLQSLYRTFLTSSYQNLSPDSDTIKTFIRESVQILVRFPEHLEHALLWFRQAPTFRSRVLFACIAYISDPANTEVAQFLKYQAYFTPANFSSLKVIIDANNNETEQTRIDADQTHGSTSSVAYQNHPHLYDDLVAKLLKFD